MNVGQRSTARNGQQGTVVEVYTNAALFQSDTGAKFTLLLCEFTPNGEHPSNQAAQLFAHVTEGFHFLRQRVRGASAFEHSIKAIPHGYVTPAKPPYTGAFLAWYDDQQRVQA